MGRTNDATREPAACGSGELECPLSRFPLRGKGRGGRVPPTPRHAPRQKKALARSAAVGSPHKRAAAPLCIPRERIIQTNGAYANPEMLISRKTNFSVDTTGPLMEAVTKGSG